MEARQALSSPYPYGLRLKSPRELGWTSPALEAQRARKAAFAEKLVEMSVLPVDEAGEVLPDHPEIAGLSNGS